MFSNYIEFFCQLWDISNGNNGGFINYDDSENIIRTLFIPNLISTKVSKESILQVFIAPLWY